MFCLQRYLFLVLALVALSCFGRQREDLPVLSDRSEHAFHSDGSQTPTDSLFAMRDSIQKPERRGFFQRIAHGLGKIVHSFNNYDHSYIEPQRYNFTVMLQNTNSYEGYTLTTASDKRVTLAPENSYRMGPYVGWQWIFLGYTIDLAHISASKNDKNRKEFDLSIYSNMIGIDLLWKKTGNNYKIRSLSIGNHVDTSPLINQDFGGFNSCIRSINVYYIFNHHHFSYPAAYSQSTIQKKSVGSFLLGLGYLNHKIDMDWAQMNEMVETNLGIKNVFTQDSTSRGNVHYTDWNVSCGYGYNWVFAKNWLLNVSLSAAVAYNHTEGNENHDYFKFRDFSIHNFNLNGIGRFGMVWNNMRWYFGTSAIFNSYNYKKNRFSVNNYFGSFNVYVGFNFG